jgi:hypothetical protein
MNIQGKSFLAIVSLGVLVFALLVAVPGYAQTVIHRLIGTNVGTLYNAGNASIDIDSTAVTFCVGRAWPCRERWPRSGLGTS